jgi:hypothetical protein
MPDPMFALPVNNLQILRRVVVSGPIYMMDFFSRQEHSA